MVATWLCVRRLFLRAGPEALVLAAGARPPAPGDLEERQLANLVEEMAIAAGITPPRVLVVDGDHANAAIVGRSVDDAVLLLPRGLLDDLGRGPTGAVVADLLALVLGGDLGVALRVASVMQTFDLVGAVLAAPTSRRTRAVLWRVGRYGLRRGRAGDPEEAQFIVDHLAALGRGDADIEPAGGCLAGMAQLPFLVGSLTFQLTRLGPGRLLLDPLLGALWRRRRLLADATAVQLTRDPGALARALAHLEERGAEVPEGPWPHLFLVAPAGPPGGQPGGHSGAEPVVTGGTAHGELVTFLPPLAERLRRLHAMGARPDVDPGVPVPAGIRVPGALATLARGARHAVVWPARLVAAAVLVALTSCLVYLSLILDALFLAPLVVLAHVVLR
jgi:Zn-dependent protease with chaperone function